MLGGIGMLQVSGGTTMARDWPLEMEISGMNHFTRCLALGMAGAAPLAVEACDVLVNSTGDVQAALDAASSTAIVCLETGYYYPTTTLTLKSGQTLRSQNNDRSARIYITSGTHQSIINTPSNTTVSGLRITSGNRATYGILTYQTSGVTIWNNHITGVELGVGVNGASSVDVVGNYFYTGKYEDGLAQPAVWVNQSSNVTVRYNDSFNVGNGPSEDGELSCYDSQYVEYIGNTVTDSGAAGIYMVNCDSTDVVGNLIDRAAEWGIDIVGGSDHVYVSENSVGASGNGGVVFFENDSVGGTFTNNVFQYNRQGGGSGNCNGINVRGSLSGITYSGNTSTPSGAICTW